MTPVRLEPTALRSRIKHSTTEPLRSDSAFKNNLSPQWHRLQCNGSVLFLPFCLWRFCVWFSFLCCVFSIVSRCSDISMGKRGSMLLYLDCFLMSCALPQSAVVSYAVCDYGVSWSYSLPFFFSLALHTLVIPAYLSPQF